MSDRNIIVQTITRLAFTQISSFSPPTLHVFRGSLHCSYPFPNNQMRNLMPHPSISINLYPPHQTPPSNLFYGTALHSPQRLPISFRLPPPPTTSLYLPGSLHPPLPYNTVYLLPPLSNSVQLPPSPSVSLHLAPSAALHHTPSNPLIFRPPPSTSLHNWPPPYTSSTKSGQMCLRTFFPTDTLASKVTSAIVHKFTHVVSRGGSNAQCWITGKRSATKGPLSMDRRGKVEHVHMDDCGKLNTPTLTIGLCYSV